MRRNPEPDISQKLKTENLKSSWGRGLYVRVNLQRTAVRVTQKPGWEPEHSRTVSLIWGKKIIANLEFHTQ